MVNTWSNDEMMKLIELWSEDIIHAQLEGSKRNAIVFNKIARDMEAAGYVKTGEQCNSKVRKLKLEYRKIVDNNNKTGRGRKDWKFFDAIDAVLGHKPATRPPVVVESGDTMSTTANREEANTSISTAGTSGEDRSLDERELTPSELSTSRSVTPIGESTADSNGKKRKRSTEKADRMEGFLDKVIKMQAESENKFLNLEEKMMEMEVQRQESREFQLQMMSLLFYRQGATTHPMHGTSASGQTGPSNLFHPMFSFPPPTPNDDDQY